MVHSQLDQFLQEATYPDQDFDWALDGDTFYGLYTNSFYVSRRTPKIEHAFWTAMSLRGILGQCLRVRDRRQRTTFSPATQQ
ncbi:hypothetical protein [Arthrobacter ipis]|uniref:hypothetical protein n=1 Tax=Arthrobacter ipis TaxID=2716202 RepID=UPI001686C1C8|nr:hypothetical protein [Arthrobacter ipis]